MVCCLVCYLVCYCVRRASSLNLGNDPTQERRVLAALLFGNFVTGTGVLLPAGMLSELATWVRRQCTGAGLLFSSAGGRRARRATCRSIHERHRSPVAARGFDAALCRVPRGVRTRPELRRAARRSYCACVPAAVFTPQAAATVGALLPPNAAAVPLRSFSSAGR